MFRSILSLLDADINKIIVKTKNTLCNTRPISRTPGRTSKKNIGFLFHWLK